MADKSFVMVSLKEDKAKKLTQALSNEKARKILEYLAKKEYATESQISKDLGIAASTTHYTLKILRDNKLVTEEEYHYSEKGKEVIHYKLANKYIIIAPDEDESVIEKLKNFIPSILALGLGALILWGRKIFTAGSKTLAESTQVADAMVRSAPENVGVALMAKAPNATAGSIQRAATAGIDPVIYFLAGGIVVLVALLSWTLWKNRLPASKK